MQFKFLHSFNSFNESLYQSQRNAVGKTTTTTKKCWLSVEYSLTVLPSYIKRHLCPYFMKQCQDYCDCLYKDIYGTVLVVPLNLILIIPFTTTFSIFCMTCIVYMDMHYQKREVFLNLQNCTMTTNEITSSESSKFPKSIHLSLDMSQKNLFLQFK